MNLASVDLEMILSIANVYAIVYSTAWGMLVGAFYGYHLNPDAPPHFPWGFYLVGLGFIITLAWVGATTANPVQAESQIARAILWSFTCGSIPIGRYARHVFTLHALRNKHRRLRSRDETPTEKQDREVGDERRTRQAQDDQNRWRGR